MEVWAASAPAMVEWRLRFEDVMFFARCQEAVEKDRFRVVGESRKEVIVSLLDQ